VRRLYYLVDDPETAVRISDKLHALGVSDWNFHVLARDQSGIYTRRLHSALPYHKQDLIRAGERWACGGAAVGTVVALILASLSSAVDLLTASLLVVIGILAGLCAGLIIGRSRENYKIARFHDDIAAGRYLIMVDVGKRSRADVIEVMNLQFGEVEYSGSDSPYVNPFVRA
jgi:hypothetical protein